MKRVIIVHCWTGYPKYCWYPQVKRELESRGFEVAVPAMPETDAPKLSHWLPKLQKIAGMPNEDLYLVGHSAGCVTIMRYLESLKDDERIGGAVFVAGFTDDLGYRELENFFETPLHFEKIRKNANHFVLIHSDDDPYVPLRQGEILKEKLEGELIVKRGMKHFIGAMDQKGSCTALPEVTEAIVKMAR